VGLLLLKGLFFLQAAFHGLFLGVGELLQGSAVAQVCQFPVFKGKAGTALAKEQVQPKLEALHKTGFPVLAFGADGRGLLT
jgi:hypothetical protein